MSILFALTLALARCGWAAVLGKTPTGDLGVDVRIAQPQASPPALPALGISPLAGASAEPAATITLEAPPAAKAAAPLLKSLAAPAAPARLGGSASKTAAAFDGGAIKDAPASVLDPDQIIYRCIELARRSKSQRARFGAIVVDKRGRIIGEGWNRQSIKAERRLIGVGFIIHAEQVAIAQAARKAKKALDGARLYVVGISKDASLYAQKIKPSPAWACQICARTLEKFRVCAMSSSAEGFREVPWNQIRAMAARNQGGKWWQASYKGKPQDPNIRWLPIADLEARLAGKATTVEERLKGFREINGKPIVNGVAFREAAVKTPDVLTLRIKRFFFDKILSGEKSFEYRVRSPQNDALIGAAIKRGAKFLRLHFQDNDIQLLAAIDGIDVVPGKAATEPWDKEQGIEPSPKPHWRIAVSRPALIWGGQKSPAAPALDFSQAVSGLLRQPFTESLEFGRIFLGGLGPAATPQFAHAIGLDAERLSVLASELSRKAAPLGFSTRLYGPLSSAKERKDKKDHAALLGVFFKDGRPAGFFGYVISDGKDGRRTGEIHSVYFDKAGVAASGIAETILAFLADDVDPALGVTRETLRADFAGRYVWARRGFLFDPKSYYYDVDGKTAKAPELARASLARFLKAHKMGVADLALRGKPVGSLDELRTPADFAELVRADGSLVQVRPLIAQDTLGEETALPLGKAFMLSDNRHMKGPAVLSQGGRLYGTKFSADAMPYWNGYRDAGR